MDNNENEENAPQAPGGVVSDHDAEAEGETEVGAGADQPNEEHNEQSNQNGTTEEGQPEQQQQQQQQQIQQNPTQEYQDNSPYQPGPAGTWSHPLNPLPPGQLPPPPASQNALAMAQYYEKCMRDHAAAYASAAAGAAWAAAQIAAQAAEFAANANAYPPMASAAAEFPPPQAALTMPLPPGFYSPTPNPSDSALVMGNNPNMYPAMPFGGSPAMHAGVDPYQYHHGEDSNYYYDSQNNYDDPGRNQSWSNNRDNFHYGGHDGHEEAYDSHHRNTRRKRYQRRPPDGITVPRRSSFNNQVGHGESNSNPNTNTNNNKSSRVRRRLRDGGDSSNSSCCSGSLGTSITSYNSDQAMSGGANSNNNSKSRGSQSNKYASVGSSHRGSGVHGGGGRGNPYHRTKKKQRQPPDDTSLCGKTAVAALYEYCGKRRMAHPTFSLVGPEEDMKKIGGHRGPDFDVAVYLEDGTEWGRGRGRTKTSAKQEAARKALHSLVPGIAFDEMSGILISLPERTGLLPSPNNSPAAEAAKRPKSPSDGGSSSNNGPDAEASASLEDLVAERLAIAPGENEEERATNKANAKVDGEVGGFSSNKLKRTWNVYPGTTTSTGTSEEEDENQWYSSRGASVLSNLLHALTYIDDRIIEPPQYSFDLSKEVNTNNLQMKRKDPASSDGACAIVIHRGTYTCSATLKVLSRTMDCPAGSEPGGVPTEAKEENNPDKAQPEPAFDDVAEAVVSETKGQPKNDGDENESDQHENVDEPQKQSDGGNDTDDLRFTVLEVKCIGATKRESKHIANAKLLALLFPECGSMVEVKAAAEAVRERYANSRTRKLRKKSKGGHQSVRGRAKVPRLSSEMLHNENDPPLPNHIVQHLQFLIETPERPASKSSIMCPSFEKLNLNQESTDEADDNSSSQKVAQNASRSEAPSSTAAQDSICRQLSRQKQLEEMVDKALQALNEHDEEGRPLPDELTADDVGLTVLRRATPEDTGRIRKLLSNSLPGSKRDASALSPVQDDGTLALRLWGANTFVLLLCRAIAAFEDPPLGCAVLTLGFSMQKGRLLRIAQIGSEPHLPRERFLELLENFAVSMGYVLERNDYLNDGNYNATGVLDRDDLKRIIGSFLGQRGGPSSERARISVSSPLQSVLEESEGGDDSDRSTEAQGKIEGHDKRKRSRVE